MEKYRQYSDEQLLKMPLQKLYQLANSTEEDSDKQHILGITRCMERDLIEADDLSGFYPELYVTGNKAHK